MVSAFSLPPARLVDAGAPAFGRFTAAPADVNLLDARFLGLPRALRSLRLKRWQALQVVSEELFLHVALFDARLLTMLQVRIYDRARDQQVSHERLLRPGAFRVATQLDDTITAYRDRRFQYELMYSRGVLPVQRLNARWNAVGTENPIV
jgi:hypothetical protein